MVRKGLLCLALCALQLGQPRLVHAAIPTQFIAKMHTEVLGRAPHPQEWKNALAFFQANDCNQANLTKWGSTTLFSKEFADLSYDAAATTLVLFRSILNREPATTEYTDRLTALEGGETLRTASAALFTSPEFGQLVPFICGGGSYSFGILGTGLAIAIPTSTTDGYSNLTEAQLQSLLDSSAPGETVYLRQESVVYLTRPLTIPAGVTLATNGSPGPNRHAMMARLVRASAFPSPMVEINHDDSPNPSGNLRNIWVDGQRTHASAFVPAAINVEIYGGNGAMVDANFIANSLGWTNLHSFGSLDGRPCSAHTITNNVVTAYSSVHANQQWSDGLSIGCENSLVRDNEIVDPTDVGIVVYNAYPAVQKSQVVNNIVISAGNSAFGGLAFDPLQNRSIGPPDFTGSLITNNTLWSGPNTHFIIGLAVGSRPWFAGGEIGRGASATGNTTAGIQTEFAAGIVVSGMHDATVQGNTFAEVPIPQSWTSCPVGDVFASVSAGLASGEIQSYTDETVNGCMSDTSPASQATPASSLQTPDSGTASNLAVPVDPHPTGGGGVVDAWELLALGLLMGLQRIGWHWAPQFWARRSVAVPMKAPKPVRLRRLKR